MISVVFDVDDTLAKIIKQGEEYTQVPDYDLIQVMRWFINNGDKVYIWSAGGTDYAQMWVNKLGFADFITVIPKVDLGENRPDIDIAFDDCENNLAKTTIIIKRDLNEDSNIARWRKEHTRRD